MKRCFTMIMVLWTMLSASNMAAQDIENINVGEYNGHLAALNVSEAKDSPIGKAKKAGMNFIVMNIKPESAFVTIDDEPVEVRNGIVKMTLPYGEHTYVVSKDGYESQTGTFEISSSGVVKLTVSLKSIMAHLSIKAQTHGAKIYIDGDSVGVNRWVGDVVPGNHSIECVKEGYAKQSRSITLAELERRAEAFDALVPVYAVLSIDYEPIGAHVVVDGKRVGDTPLVLNDILVGHHNVSISATGYGTLEETVYLSEDSVNVMNGILPNDPIEDLRVLADAGDTDAQYELGCKLQFASGFMKNYKEAAKWYRQAADAGHAGAMNNLGYMYERALGVPGSYKEALKWYSKSANAGYEIAMYNMGKMYENGNGVDQSYSESAHWYQKAADLGCKDAMKRLAYLYKRGLGVPKDTKKAKEWRKKAKE